MPSTDVQSDDDEDEENEDEFLPGFDDPIDLKPAEIGNPIEHFFSRIVTFNDKEPKIAIWTKNIWALLCFLAVDAVKELDSMNEEAKFSAINLEFTSIQAGVFKGAQYWKDNFYINLPHLELPLYVEDKIKEERNKTPNQKFKKRRVCIGKTLAEIKMIRYNY